MRCPKCQYISFDRGDRCRNCGYEFSLTVAASDLDLPLKTGEEPIGPLTDFSLAEVDGLNPSVPPQAEEDPQAPRASARSARGAPPTGDLPLFRDRSGADDAPLVSLPAVPRAPVAVRRSSPSPRSGNGRRPAEGEPELDLELPVESRPTISRPAAHHGPAEPPAASDHVLPPAPAGLRLLAAAVDLVLVGAIDAAVLYLTLEVSGLTWAELWIIPVVPFLAFLVLLNGGYIVTFTAAGGQSIGKMAAGIRIVTAEAAAWTDRVPLGQAVLRAVGYIAAALPFGLGFLPAFVGPERRGVHDRLAHTRVVKA